jgi:uncharacterized protein YlxP (DUF503 family)
MAPYTIIIGLLTIELDLPDVHSLKQKRSILKSLLARLHNTFNVSAAEVGYHDTWQSTAIAITAVTNSSVHAHQIVSNVLEWVENNYPDLTVTFENIEII